MEAEEIASDKFERDDSPELEGDHTRLPKREVINRMKIIDSNLLHERIPTAMNAHQTVPNALRKQVEFYFGDPNLSKDHYLRELISKHKKGYVEVKSLLGFHKIENLFNTAHIARLEDRLNYLKNAISSSSLLKLCKQKLRVKRIVPFDPASVILAENIADVDNRTIYLENIPTFATHEMIASVFSKYGKILHVRLPHEKPVQRPATSAQAQVKSHKGFAFIEFSVNLN